MSYNGINSHYCKQKCTTVKLHITESIGAWCYIWSDNYICWIYRQTSNINPIKSQHLIFLISSCSFFCQIHWGHVLSQEWRCSWSRANRQCSDYIWVIHNCRSEFRLTKTSHTLFVRAGYGVLISVEKVRPVLRSETDKFSGGLATF